MEREKQNIKRIALLKFREKLMAEELEQYRIHLTGEYESILPYIRDGEGHYSPEKTEEVIEELVGYVRLYHEYEADCSLREQEEMYGREWTEAGNVFPGFSEEAETFFRNFFYCALRISEAEELCDVDGEDISGATQTFHDLLWFSGDHYERQAQLYAEEAVAEGLRNNYDGMKGIYRPASWLVHLFTGKNLSDLYPEDLQKKYIFQLPVEIRNGMERVGCKPSEYFDYFLDGISSSAEQRTEKAAEEVRKRFSEQEKFVESYLSFRSQKYDPAYDSLYVGGSIDKIAMMETACRLEDDVKTAVLMFLEKRGLSHLEDDDTYFTAAALLRRAGKRVKETALRDERRMHG